MVNGRGHLKRRRDPGQETSRSLDGGGLFRDFGRLAEGGGVESGPYLSVAAWPSRSPHPTVVAGRKWTNAVVREDPEDPKTTENLRIKYPPDYETPTQLTLANIGNFTV